MRSQAEAANKVPDENAALSWVTYAGSAAIHGRLISFADRGVRLGSWTQAQTCVLTLESPQFHLAAAMPVI